MRYHWWVFLRTKKFDLFGKIRDINLKQGYHFVQFEDAVYEMNNQSLCGGRITFEHAKGTDPSRNFYNDKGGDRYRGRRGDYGAEVEATTVCLLQLQ